MNHLETLLIRTADALRAMGSGLLDALAGVLGFLSSLVQPVLSPLLVYLNPLFTTLADGYYAALLPLGPGAALVVLSVLAGVASLLVFRVASNQAGIGRALDQMKANLLAMRLYKDDLRVTFRSQGRLLLAAGRLQWHMLPPFVVMLIPMMPALAQMAARHQWRPLRPGEQALVRVVTDPNAATAEPPALEAAAGVAAEVPGIAGGGQTVWRIRAVEVGTHRLRFRGGGHEWVKEVVVGGPWSRVSPILPRPEWTTQLLYPGERPLPTEASVRLIDVQYPETPSTWYGADYWILSFFVVSLLTAFLLRGLFRVRF